MVQRIQRRMPAKRLKEPDCPERSGAYEGESSLARRTRRCTQRKPFPKKSSGILRKGNRLEAYRFIDEHRNLFGVRWLLRRFGIYPNAYYNYRKHRRAKEDARKQNILRQIQALYHETNGVAGYRRMQVDLARKGIELSALTVHKYMNTELGLRSIVRQKAPRYQGGIEHKKFENLLKQDFTATQINQKWATDFTCLFLKGGDVRYNCTIIDLYDRSVVASLTDRRMTSDLAIRTLGKALSSQRKRSNGLILHSDQGSPYTSKAFTDFCEEHNLTQSMSKAGCPYDNAPMERYFNTLKNEEIYLHEYRDEESLYRAVEHFAYTIYNHVRPHSYNGYRTPFEARYST